MTYDTLERENKHFYGRLARVALPIAIQSLIGSSLNLVDSLMVGSLGESQLAAVGVSVQIYFIFWMIVYGFSSGCSTFMAQFWGAKNTKQIRKTIGFTLTVCMAIGILFFLGATFFPEKILRIFTNIPETIALGTQYVRAGGLCFLFIAIILPFECALRATQQTHIPLFSSIAAFITNTILNYLLIFGSFGAPELGIKGAAIATVLSRFLQVLITIYIVFIRKNILCGRLHDYFGWPKAFVLRVVKNSIPTTINETMWGLGTAFYVAIFARVGITECAAVQAANTIQNILQMAAFSMGDAVLIMVGQKIGEGKMEEAYVLAKRLLKVGTIIGVIFGLTLIGISKPIISLFNFTPEGAYYTFMILCVYGLFMGLVLYNGINIVGVLRCGGDTRYAMFTEVGTVWIIGVPLAFFTALVLHWPIYIAVLVVKSEEIIKCIILTKRFVSKKWIKSLVRHS